MKVIFMIMKDFFLVLICAGLSVFAYTQNQNNDPVNKLIEEHDSTFTQDGKSIINNNEGENDKLIISGYIQAQYENYQEDLVEPSDAMNTFFIRRARLKFTYQALEGVKFVLQPDFAKKNLLLKDAYAELSIPKLNSVSLLAGKFERPNYEFVKGSVDKEILERSRILRNIYPERRDIGIKLQYKGINLPLKLQFALLNGNFDESQTKDIDTRKDIMGLASYCFVFPEAGINIDLGAYFYAGGLKAKSTRYISDYYGAVDSITLGDYLDRTWTSYSIQVFTEILGGTTLKFEFLKGRNAYDVNSSSPASMTNPYRVRDFSGFYLYFIKNIGLKNQFIARYDYFDPNMKVSGDAAGSDVFYKTLAFVWEYYLNDHIDLGLSYEFLTNEISSEVNETLRDNLLRARIQVKF